MDSYVGTIWSFAFGFEPLGWKLCNGQLLPIAQYEMLFSLLGTTFGGDGQTNFALPDLRGRIPIGTGKGGGLAPYALGQMGGSECETLTAANLPPHTHPVTAASIPVGDSASASTPGSNYFASSTDVGNAYSNQSAAGNALATFNMTAQPTGSNLPISIVGPYQVVNYCICVEGIYPARP